MQFYANVGVLKKLIAPVANVAIKSTLKDAEDSYRITLDAKKDRLKIYAFGGHLSISAEFESDYPGLNYECETEGFATVIASDLESNLDSFKDITRISCVKGNDFQVRDAADEEEMQSQPVFSDPINIPDVATKFLQEVEIDREIFIKGITSVAHAACALSAKQEGYKYLRLTTKKDTLDFSAGDGTRFASITISGDQLFAAPKDDNVFLIPNAPLIILQKNLKESKASTIKILQSDGSENVPDQFIIRIGDYTVSIVGVALDISWPKIESLWEADKQYRVVTKGDCWVLPAKGVCSTFNDEVRKSHDSHEAIIEIDVQKALLTLSANYLMKSNRKIPIERFKDKAEDSIKVMCSSAFLQEIAKNSKEEDDILVEINSDVEPIYISMPEREDTNKGCKEQFKMFFAALKG